MAGEESTVWGNAAAAGNPDADAPVHAGHLFRSLGGVGVISLAGLAFSVAMTRLLSLADVGRIGIVRPVLELLLIPAGLGMPVCIAKHAGAGGLLQSDRDRIYRTGTAMGLASAALLGAGVFILMRHRPLTTDPAVARYLGWMALLLPAMVFYETGIGFLRGTGRIPSLAASQAGRGVVLLALGIPLTAALGLFGWGAGRGLTELCAAGIVLYAVRAAWSRRSMSQVGGETRRSGVFDAALARGFLSFGVFSAMTQAALAVPAAAEVLILERTLSDTELIGRYSMARLVFDSVMLIPGAFLQAHFHRAAARAGDREAAWDQFVQDSGAVLVIIAPVVFAGWIAAPYVRIVFGPEYAVTGVWLQGMLPAVCIRSAAMVASSFAVAVGRVRANFLAAAAGTVVAVGLSLTLIPRFGAPGAIMAMTAAFSLRAVLGWLIMIRFRYEGRLRG